jgi:uncharacterized membrane protein YqjE
LSPAGHLGNDKEPVSGPLRRLGSSLLTLGRIRLELLAIEVQEEKDRIAGLLLWASRCGTATACWRWAAAPPC